MSRTRKKKKRSRKCKRHLGKSVLFFSVVQVPLGSHLEEAARSHVLQWIVLGSLVWSFL